MDGLQPQDIVNSFEDVKSLYDFDFDLKTEQITVIQSVLNEKNTFAVLPTGFGKSVTYILPPLILDEMDWSRSRTSLVVSPLKSLMKDQTAYLCQKGVSATFIGNETTPQDIIDIKDGKYSVVFSSPESITKPYWREMLLNKTFTDHLCLLCFDEAHCITEWGDDYRPDYKQVNVLRSFVDVPILILTATCTQKMQDDILNVLQIQDITKVALLPDRPNISLEVMKVDEDASVLEWLELYLTENMEMSMKTIVYCRSVSVTSELYCRFMEKLCCYGMGAGPNERIVEMFHKNIDEDSHTRILNEFCKLDSKIRILFSTVAFGMGVQIPDVKLVIHWGAPKSLLSYWQEVGRAGRDGKRAHAICIAYGRSLDKRRTEKEVKSMVANECAECIRLRVLQFMMTDGMDVGVLDRMKVKERCDGRCTKLCKCEMCLCCSFCKEKCKCDNKAVRYIDLIL